MSDDSLIASKYRRDYLQSPVDDLYSFYYTMQWAAVFHNQEFAAKEKDIPFELKILRENLLGTQSDRSFVTTEIVDPSRLRPRECGSVVSNCQPVLRAWYMELRGLRDDWKDCLYELEGQETKAEIYKHLFSTFAVRGVATLAELVHKYTKDMD